MCQALKDLILFKGLNSLQIEVIEGEEEDLAIVSDESKIVAVDEIYNLFVNNIIIGYGVFTEDIDNAKALAELLDAQGLAEEEPSSAKFIDKTNLCLDYYFKTISSPEYIAKMKAKQEENGASTVST